MTATRRGRRRPLGRAFEAVNAAARCAVIVRGGRGAPLRSAHHLGPLAGRGVPEAGQELGDLGTPYSTSYARSEEVLLSAIIRNHLANSWSRGSRV